MKIVLNATTLLLTATTLLLCHAYNLNQPKTTATSASTTTTTTNRRNVLTQVISTIVTSTGTITALNPAVAFDGSGASAYAGKSPTTKVELQKSYKARIIADVKDFNALGNAISNGQLEGKEWISFFIQYARREPDSVGRTYAALADLIGSKDIGGGCGMLLATSYGKPNKPPDNVPAVKKFNPLLKAFDPIKAAGEAGDVKKAQKAWQKAAMLFSEYLVEVELPGDLSDPIYN